MYNTDLTILLTTKGRDLFTLRWLWYANAIKLPYHIYIADGQPNDIIVKILADKNNFPNISYQHELYNDAGYKEYYRKIEHALNKINTKYVMLSDNDDFLLPEGIARSISFLNFNESFVGASGRVGFFYVSPNMKKSSNNLFGSPKYIFPEQGGYAPRNIEDVKAAERIKRATDFYNVTYYSVFRTNALHNAATENADICFNSLLSTELFFHLRVLCAGSVYFDKNSSSYIRQLGTSAGDGGEDIFHELVSSRLSEDYTNLIRSIIQDSSIEVSEKLIVEKNINIFLEKYIKNRIIAQLSHEKTLHNKSRILFRKIMAFILPSYKDILWKYRRSREVKMSGQIENKNDLITVETCLNNPALKEFLLLSGLPKE